MNIFVAKLGQSTTGDSLKSLFEQFGPVTSAKVITDRETGNSKGYGFVEMTTAEDADMAIEKLNETEFEGSVIVVKKAKPKGQKGNNQRRFGRRY
ncbi:MAG: RNA-binding protein [Bacteroidia bacterium]|nr:RNA-binding protein [Bacteroidia bacterium]